MSILDIILGKKSDQAEASAARPTLPTEMSIVVQGYLIKKVATH